MIDSYNKEEVELTAAIINDENGNDRRSFPELETVIYNKLPRKRHLPEYIR